MSVIDNMEGKILGNYRITSKIGEGGMGSVYLARDLTLERHVAIKIIAPELARDPQLMARFRIEAIAQARFNHSNIVTIHSFDQQNEIYFIVMEFVDGKTLKEIINENGRLPLQQALLIVSRILDGLAYAHSKGVLHRDIKPANIFITSDNSVKIGDFGIAKIEGVDGLTRIGTPIGTPLYSSPEQIRGQKMSPATDIYSIGVTLYEMVTGVPPFGAGSGSNYEIQRSHLEKTPQKPSCIVTAIPPRVDAIIMKSLAKSPEARFPSAGDFKKAVDRLLGGEKEIKLPKFRLPKMNLSGKKLDIKIPNLQGAIKSLKNVINTPAPTNTNPPLLFDKRKLLIILIPLLILILIIIAYSEENHPDKKIKKESFIKAMTYHEKVANHK